MPLSAAHLDINVLVTGFVLIYPLDMLTISSKFDTKCSRLMKRRKSKPNIIVLVDSTV